MRPRLRWSDLPESVRLRVQHRLGAEVSWTIPCTGGFSPSTAEIVAADTGRRLFVKAVRAEDNPDSPRMNRAEAHALAHIPSSAPVPAFVDAFTDGDWFVLVTEVGPGQTPAQPWTGDDLDHVLDALDHLQSVCTPNPVPDLPRAADALAEDFLGFSRIAEDRPPGLDPWILEHLRDLELAEERGLAAIDGETLCHLDVRADNLLIAPGGGVSVVDWAHACRGPRWLDALLFLGTVEDRHGELAVSARIDELMTHHGLPRRTGTDVLCAFLGFFVDAARRPDPESVPGLGAHRARYAEWLVPLIRLRRRTEMRA
ncbi:aminoglycoside phosphotransferase family protein [Brachybacterium phenoliresistens]|uniref:aminoglycoside phosphotransferase family protein n=1 Tax=Brachybacterium phenoliresistens TaxID=396014 RepID=UPI0031E110BF